MAKELKFQEAMKRLDEIITILNGNDIELEDAMQLFEEGIKLSNQCEKQLKQFEIKMETLMKKEDDDAE
ncbi:MAG: exodeoxyribonuclease VII small subunit [Holdemanella sp.]|mgnify:CR=1 FL=1|nr:exodeoxyribonuclease VII small subunit [Holdemanella sp.]